MRRLSRSASFLCLFLCLSHARLEYKSTLSNRFLSLSNKQLDDDSRLLKISKEQSNINCMFQCTTTTSCKVFTYDASKTYCSIYGAPIFFNGSTTSQEHETYILQPTLRNISFTTPTDQPTIDGTFPYTNLSQYNITFSSSDDIYFQAKACSSVHVGLFSENQTSPFFYELVINDVNKQVYIKQGQNSLPLVSVTASWHLDCLSYTPFMINWRNDGKIEVTRQLSDGQWKVIFLFLHSTVQIGRVGLTTGDFQSGSFKL